MEYVDQYNQQITEAKKNQLSLTKRFLDNTNTLQDRLDAFKDMGTLTDPGDILKAEVMMRDVAADPRLRAAALESITTVVGRDEGLMKEIISFIGDINQPDALRDSALSVIKTKSFSSPLYEALAPQFYEELKKIVTQDNAPLKTVALQNLAQEKDPFAQNKLIEGLENPTLQLVQPELAIQFLSYDIHTNIFPTLRRIVQNPPNFESKREAIRILSGDPSSSALLRNTLEDENENPEIRHASALSLQLQDPKEMEKISKNLILKKEVNPELKTALLNTLIHTVEPASLVEDKSFVDKLEQTHLQSDSPSFQHMYRQFTALDGYEKPIKHTNLVMRALNGMIAIASKILQKPKLKRQENE